MKSISQYIIAIIVGIMTTCIVYYDHFVYFPSKLSIAETKARQETERQYSKQLDKEKQKVSSLQEKLDKTTRSLNDAYAEIDNKDIKIQNMENYKTSPDINMPYYTSEYDDYGDSNQYQELEEQNSEYESTISDLESRLRKAEDELEQLRYSR